jgi:hypothetical protein
VEVGLRGPAAGGESSLLAYVSPSYVGNRILVYNSLPTADNTAEIATVECRRAY